ncbi:HNH endonuclease signature motif containing protein, partial [Corynebacterium sp. HMSC072A04]
MRKHVEGRDGTCRVGGCGKPAFLSQLDHRHNWAEGGPTHPKNLACLCQGHHNMKTDGSLKYLLDPYSGDVICLFEDGTWTITEADGPLAPKQKRWAQTVAQHITATRKRVREEAQHLKQELDDYAQQQAKAKAEAEAKDESKTNADAGTDDIPF